MRFTKWIYAIAISLSAFLLFQVQPMLGKVILPLFGGTASAWVICLLFFQTVLLLGYYYAHFLTTRFNSQVQGIVHLIILFLAVFIFDANFDSERSFQGSLHPTVRILLFLGFSIFLPYFVLSTTGPLLQAWFAADYPKNKIYRLFALSNLGSMLGLLTYPIAFEPRLSLHQQGRLWSYLFALFAIATGTLAWQRYLSKAQFSLQQKANRQRNGKKLFFWIALSFLSTSALMSVTSHMTQNIAPIPLLWVLPLALYLLSFILCFESERWYSTNWYFLPFAASLAGLVFLQNTEVGDVKVQILIPMALVCVFIIFMVCHGELSRLKPSTESLTSFYLSISLGGVLGGIFIGIIAPSFFRNDYELAVSIVLCSLIIGYLYASNKDFSLNILPLKELRLLGKLAFIISIFFLTYFAAKEHIKVAKNSLFFDRNFYGSLRVKEQQFPAKRVLYHGLIIHGEQVIEPDKENTPTTYYGIGTGAEFAIQRTRTEKPQKVGLIGLGAGTLLSYGRKNDIYRIYEINPLMVDVATTHFTYLGNSQSYWELIMGDARLSLAKEKPQNFDVILVDAFSGDSIPVHLLTKEAIELYLSHLKPNGILAIHISNKFLNLAPIIQLTADALSKRAYVLDNEDNEREYVYGSTWAMIDNGKRNLESETQYSIFEINVGSAVRIWTDDYSSLIPILKF